MTRDPDTSTLQITVSRRGFMAGGTALTFAFTMGAGLGGRLPVAEAAAGQAQLNAWVTITADNTIRIIAPCAEMGQGIHTALPLIVAEELDADWSKVKVEFAPANPKAYGNPHQILNGGQATLASIAVAGYWRPLRLAGAQARRVLLEAVAQEWKVPVGELSTEPSAVVHKASGRRIAYGDVVKFAKVPDQPPTIAEADLKEPGAFRLVGKKDLGRVDVPAKVDGSAKYGIDVRVPDMVYAAVLESPMDGAKPGKVDSAEAVKVKGVTRVLPLPFGVAVIGDTVEATRAGRNALKVEWDTSGAKASGFDSDKAMAEYASHGRDPNAQVKEAFKRGDARAAMEKAAKVVEAAYWSQHAYHAQMEPMTCTAKVAEDGKSAELWVGTQAQALATMVAANVLKTTPDKITLHQQYLGGGFGRRITPDVVAQAVVIANIVKRPVKLILTREDDFAAARPRPMTYHILRAGLDGGNNIIGWHHRLVAENVDAVAAPPRFQATGGRDYIGWLGLDQPFYALPNLLADSVREQRGLRVHAWRGIGAGHNKFASESFLDEVAAAKGADPLALRLELTKDHPRANAVIKAAAEMAEWGRKRDGRGLGIAFSDYHGTYTAGVAEVSLDRQSGKITVHNYWIAVDPGIVVHPDSAVAQVESAVVYGLSATLLEALTFKDGAVQQSNFHEYHVLRMMDVPDIHVRMISTDNPPTGMGEVGVPTTAPAVGNAIFALAGKRLRHMPMTPERVLEALKG
jgi:isoquinoline 1-oxidoreductase beta subunit